MLMDSIKKLNTQKYADYDCNRKYLKLIHDNTIYELLDFGSDYKEIITTNGNFLKNVSLYNKKTLILIFEANSFIDCPIGLMYKYNSDGILSEIIDYNEHYDFSIYNLIEKLSDDFNIDAINSQDRLSIFKYENPLEERYEYHIRYSVDKSKSRLLKINGTNGKTLEDVMTSNYY